MGRHAKPPELHILEGNKNRLTKSELEHRKNSQIRLGTKKFSCPPHIKSDPCALKKWKEIIKLYKNDEIDIATSSDTGVISRYCSTYSEYMYLIHLRDDMVKKWNKESKEPLLQFTLMKELGVETRIDKKNELLLKLEGQLFLTPLAKIKSIPKKAPTEGDQMDMFLQDEGFAHV